MPVNHPPEGYVKEHTYRFVRSADIADQACSNDGYVFVRATKGARGVVWVIKKPMVP